MKRKFVRLSESSLICAGSLKAMKAAITSLHRYSPGFYIAKLLFMILFFCSACGNSNSVQLPDIKFDKANWSVKKDEQYTYRKQMVNDLLNNHQWAGMHKDSVIQMLGQPDDTEEGNLAYYYERKPFLGGLGTAIESVVFELSPDSTVKLARLNDGGWD